MPHRIPRARACLTDARRALYEGRRADAVVYLEQLDELLADRSDQPSLDLQQRAEALRRWQEGDVEQCLALQDELITRLRAHNDQRALASELIRDAGVRMVSGIDGVDERLAEGSAVAEATGDLELLARAWCTQAMLALRRNRAGEAVVAGLAGAEAGRRSRASAWVCAAEGTVCSALHQLGDLPGAERIGRKALDLADSTGQTRAATDLRLDLVAVLLDAGQTDEARQMLDEAAGALPDSIDRLVPKLAAARAAVDQAWGEMDTAEAAAREALDGWGRVRDRLQEGDAVALLVQLAVERQDAEAAQALVADPRLEQAAPARAALARARSAALSASPEEATELAHLAAQLARSEGAPKIRDDALQLAIAAHVRGGDTMSALQTALMLAEARSNRLRRVQEVHASAEAARRRVQSRAERVARTRAAAESPHLLGVMERMSHGVRNALAMVSANAELLADPKPVQPRSVVLDRTIEAVELVERRLDEALDQARAAYEASGSVALAPLVRGVLAQLSPAAEGQQVWVPFEALAPMHTNAPAALVAEILHSVLRGALRRAPVGGRVALTLGESAPWAALRIREEGAIGDPDDALDLDIARRMAERCQGRLVVDAEAPATIRLLLPMAPPDA